MIKLFKNIGGLFSWYARGTDRSVALCHPGLDWMQFGPTLHFRVGPLMFSCRLPPPFGGAE